MFSTETEEGLHTIQTDMHTHKKETTLHNHKKIWEWTKKTNVGRRDAASLGQRSHIVHIHITLE